MTQHGRRSTRQPGFTLIEIAVVLVIVAVMIAMGAVMFRGVVAAQKRSLTTTRLATVDAALVQFVQLNRRLPCPAVGTIPSSAANAGVEAPIGGGACTNTQQFGVVPWVTLGITETDATDGWDRRITYRAHASLVLAAGAMDMSWCDPAGTEGIAPNPILAIPRACNSTGTCSSNPVTSIVNCTPPAHYLSGKGLRVQNVAGTNIVMDPPNTGAAYVLISHGESGGGAYLGSGISTTSTTDGTEEQKNYASLVLQAYYLDDSTTDVAGTSHFDDIVSRPSVLALASKAGLGPRSH